RPTAARPGSAPLAFRSPAVGPGTGRAALRLRGHARDLQARSAARVRVLLPARARGREARGPPGPQGGSEDGTAARPLDALREGGEGGRSPRPPGRASGARALRAGGRAAGRSDLTLTGLV